jgi:hypothetical protein
MGTFEDAAEVWLQHQGRAAHEGDVVGRARVYGVAFDVTVPVVVGGEHLAAAQGGHGRGSRSGVYRASVDGDRAGIARARVES